VAVTETKAPALFFERHRECAALIESQLKADEEDAIDEILAGSQSVEEDPTCNETKSTYYSRGNRR
jgi:hypothetical protein